jgi:hypothetical protein
MTDKQLLEQALEALEKSCPATPQDFPAHGKAITAIRARLEQPEQEIDWKDQYEKQKLRAEMWIAKYENDIGPIEYAIPAAPVQEPVACVQDLDEVKRKHLVYEKGMDWKDPLYTAPPAAQRQWVGLTETDKTILYANYGLIEDQMRAVDSLLREKNGH